MVESPDYVTPSTSSILSANSNTDTSNISNISDSKTGSDSSLATPGRQRPVFSLESDSSDENDDEDDDGKPACPAQKQPINRDQAVFTTINDEILKTFPHESQHSFSFAYISQSSISSRLDILKRSLEFLKNNPNLANLGHLQSSSSTTALEGFFKTSNPPAGKSLQEPPQSSNSRRGSSSLRSSASSAALSMLTNYTSSHAAEPSLTAFDTNLKSILVLLENAHVFPSKSGLPADSAQGDAQNILLALQSDSHPIKPGIVRAVTNPAIFMTGSSITVPRRSGTNNTNSHSQLTSIPSQPGSNADLPTLMDPAKIRKRTKTNVASFNLQSQLLESLAMPYVDESWTSIIKRVGSVAQLNSINTNRDMTGSSLNLSRRVSSAALSNLNSTLFHPLASKFASNQSVFTTSAQFPYTILTGNDMGCLLFGMSKAEMRKMTIKDLIGGSPAVKTRLIKEKLDRKDLFPGVLLCGEIMPISKSNGQAGYCSFWAKRHSTTSANSDKGIMTWVIEEVVCDSAMIDVDLTTGVVSNICGAEKNILFPYVTSEAEENGSILIHDILSGMPEDLEELKTRKQSGIREHHVTISGTDVIPCSTAIVAGEENKVSIELLSLPHMAGVVMIDTATFNISDYNASFMNHLFGYDTEECKGWNINDLIPNFTDLVDLIKVDCDVDLVESNGLVLPEHLFRKTAALRTSRLNADADLDEQQPKKTASSASLSDEAQLDGMALFMKSRGIDGLHKDGHIITIDVQLRTIGGSNYALWITYSRNITGAHEAKVPSQLSLLSVKKRSLHHRSTSTFSDTGHGRHSSESSTNSMSATSLGSSIETHKASELPQRMTSSASTSVSKMTVNTSVVAEEAPIPQQPKTPTSPPAEKITKFGAFAQTPLRTPREQILKQQNEAPNSASSVYSIHIPELGARRREKTLNDFTILQKMGEGSYGKVLLAEYKEEPHLRVVLKCVVKERILVDTWTRDRKLGTIPSEIKVMAVLNKWPHDNIIQLLDFFEDDEFYHIEMEPHGNPGTDLFDLIELQPTMPESQCKSIFKQVVAAVKHLHEHDIVHRDIKDENIIVDGDGFVKLIDFGSSAFVRQGPFDVFVGTIDYAAPEVLSGRPYEGKPQDVWALGILLYTIVYKENPFYTVDEIMDHELRVPYVTSESCLDLVKMILTRDLRKRPEINAIWEHPWMVEP
ncbi:similar to Saccharomyces cerevisiae YOL045W PSK2 One of two (see also PSK1) PAS domain containing S/T protein kinases [Geotrichum candidum]|uniref:non-specific serine/threonine protein kinase n=1 Tax=Geotrichum candidum TaxID=1173061 RepID=A0A0J9XJ98_GEOCN|nr:similar to Saccharomyces cerevisiae YOL045W PSK2 One of two (see also PSK1) PAS domain containing S/T protein kinases [Geotrichum candidum]